MTSRTAALAGLVVATLAAAKPAAAQIQLIHFTADFSGGQVVPPTGSAGTGVAIITFDDPQPIVRGEFLGLGTAQTAVHIHGPAGPGTIAPIIFTVMASGTTSGIVSDNTLPLLNAQQEADLRAGLWYIDIHTGGFPGGEIRGQLRIEPSLNGSQTGAQVVPAVATAAMGSVFASLTPAQTFVYFNVGYLGVAGGHTGVHIHGPAAPGATAPVLFTLASSSPSTFGWIINYGVPITPTQLVQLKAGLFYADVHSAAHPDGEIRGQIKLANKPVDFDADSRAEIGVFRSSNGFWYTQNPATSAFSAEQFGTSGDWEVPGDYDGDGKTDVAVWRASTGTWYVRRSSDGSFYAQPFGASGDRAIPGDYDGDGRADFAVYRDGSPQSYFYILQSSNGAVRTVPWGTFADKGLLGDFDGDRRTDVAVYRPSTGTYWVLRSSDNGVLGQQWGVYSTDWISPSDYDGDAKTDMAVYRFSGAGAGTWYILQSTTGTMRAEAFGAVGDRSEPVDVDGDGKTDLVVTRDSGTAWTWYVWRSATSTLLALVFGLNSDVPLPQYLVR